MKQFSLRESYIWMNHVKTFRISDIKKLKKLYGDFQGICDGLFNTSDDELERLKGAEMLKDETLDEIVSMKDGRWRENLERELESKGIGVTTLADEDYPQRLRTIPDAPKVIYYRGNLALTEEEITIGIIGTRRPTYYGVAMAGQFAAELSQMGMVVISGLALGIDEKSHRAALDAGGKTIAVLGCGVDICYPQNNMASFLEICEKGLLLSEYEPGYPPLRNNFPARNRIISGLSDGLLVVEAAMQSGTLITADCALEQGKEVFAIPGRASDLLSKGTNSLIKQGAMLVDAPIDIVMDMMNIDIPVEKIERKGRRGDNIYGLNEDEKNILSNLGYEPVYIDDLVRVNRMDVSGTLSILRKLEQKKLITNVEQSYYVLAK